MRTKTKTTIRCGLLLLTALTLLAACSKQSEQPAKQEAAPKPQAAAQPTPAATDPKRLYCKEHQCYEDVCIFCHEELREKGRLWCKEHNRYEDRCWECHADQRDTKRAYCEKHFLYVDECFMCKPELKDKPKPAAQTAPDTKWLMCKEHSVPEDECGICHPDLVGKMEPGQGLKVRFPSAAAAAKAGIETAPPKVGPMADGVDCYAEVVFNQNKLAQIAVPVGGIIQSVDVDLGSKVTENAVLAKIKSASISEAVSRVVLTRQTVERERKLRADRVSSEKDLQEAESAYQTALQQLKTLGFDDAQIDTLGKRTSDAGLLEIRAPFAGEIVERNAVRGALVEAGKSLFTLADRSTMWAMLNIPEKHVARARIGQQVELRFDAVPGKTFTGTLTWIAAKVDDRTRMAQARAEVADSEGLLRAQMFARARVLTGSSDKAVVVPQSAIQCIENKQFVFVKLAADLFEARPVRVGGKLNGSVEITEGIRSDEPVVVSGGFIAKSQLLISRLGAGCVDD